MIDAANDAGGPASVEDLQDGALRELLRALKARDYRFVTPSPATHARVLARPRDPEAEPLRDLLGWSRSVPAALIDAEVVGLLRRADGLIDSGDGLIASRYRVSADGGALYLHSAYPTTQTDAVFFGPDSYRFASFIRRRITPAVQALRIAEIGAGSGVGGLTAGRVLPHAGVTLTDINPLALRLARVNAAAAGVPVDCILTSGLNGVYGAFDLIVANPPYMIDAAKRTYRHGGAQYGAQVALDWADEALGRVVPGGRVLLYGGAPVVAGRDVLRDGLEAIAAKHGARLDYEEIDPDVWGEELERPDYAQVERIAVGGAELIAR